MAEGELFPAIEPYRTAFLPVSARGYHRVMRVARTLAELEASAGVRRLHVAEALSHRRIAPARS